MPTPWTRVRFADQALESAAHRAIHLAAWGCSRPIARGLAEWAAALATEAHRRRRRRLRTCPAGARLRTPPKLDIRKERQAAQESGDALRYFVSRAHHEAHRGRLTCVAALARLAATCDPNRSGRPSPSPRV